MTYIVMKHGDRWLVGYMLPANVFAPVADCPTEAAAQAEARRMTQEAVAC